MSEPSSQTPLPSPGWTILARGDQENETIARCPGGHIHLDYGYLTVRFQRDEFLAFARMVAEAAAHMEGYSFNISNLNNLKNSVTFSRN